MSERDDAKPGVSVDGKLVITDLLGLGKAVEKLTPAVVKLIEAAQAGAGKIYEPAGVYLNSRAENAANRANALADAKAFINLETRSPAVMQAMRERILGIEYRRQENIQEAQLEAARISQKNTSERVHDINQDFFIDWIEGVKDVSDEQVRSAWAHILAGATSQPLGRVPKPIVDFLRQLDGELALRLKTAFEQSAATGFIPFSEAAVGELAEEIGMGGRVMLRSVSVADGLLTVYFIPQAGFFQLSSRAQQLARIIFPQPDIHIETYKLIKRLDTWMMSCIHSMDADAYKVAAEFQLWVATGSDKIYSVFVASPVVEQNAQRETALEKVAELRSDTPMQAAIKDALHSLAVRKYLRYHPELSNLYQ